MIEAELQGVLKALRGAGINVVAVHQHMTGEVPRIMFLHYWGIGSTEALARGLKTALDTQKRSDLRSVSLRRASHWVAPVGGAK